MIKTKIIIVCIRKCLKFTRRTVHVADAIRKRFAPPRYNYTQIIKNEVKKSHDNETK